MSAKLPKSWGLKTKKRADGKLDIVGKTDFGSEYKVRTTSGPEVTDNDIAEMRVMDREAYSNRDAGVRQAVKHLIGEPDKERTMSPAERMEAALNFNESEWIAAAEPVVRAGFEKVLMGSTSSYRKGWEQAFGKEN